MLYDDIKAARHKRAAVIEGAGQLLTAAREEERDLTAEEQSQFEARHTEAEEMLADIRRLEQQYEAEKDLETVGDPEPRTVTRDGVTPELRERVIRKAVCQGPVDMDSDEVALAERFGLSFDGIKETRFKVRLFPNAPASRDELREMLRERKEQRAQSVGSDGGGGYLVADDNALHSQLEIARLAFGGVAGVARVFRSNSGAPLPIPTVDDTSNEGALVAENAAVGEQDVAFNEVQLDAFKYTSREVKASLEFFQDSAVPVTELMGRLLGERLARIHNRHQTTGTGTGQPNGVVTAAGAGVTAGAVNTFTRDEIIDLEHALDPDYRQGARFMMHDNSVKIIKKLSVGASDSRPLWQPGLAVGAPDTILGYPFVVNQHMDGALATGDDAVLFGDFSKYLVREVMEIEVFVLRELHLPNGQISFLAFSRMDADLLDAGTDPVKKLTTA